MRVSIEVRDRREGEVMRVGLDDPAVRAFVVIVGTLKPLSKRAQGRVLRYVMDRLEEEEGLISGNGVAG